MPSLNHAHVYQRLQDSRTIYRCKHPDCMHFVDKKLLMGKRAKCVCGNDFILDAYNLSLKNPHCKECTDVRKRPKKYTKKPIMTPAELTDIFDQTL